MIINIILDINSGINTWFRESKLPKFIKIFECKRKRAKLKKRINRFVDPDKTTLQTSDIYEFFTYAFNNLEKKFMYINVITVFDEPGNPTYSASMSYDNSDSTRSIYHFTFIGVTNEKMDISITRENEQGSTKLCNLKCKHQGLFEIREPEYPKFTSELIGGLNAMILEMIKEMLYKELERSERIYEL